MEKSGSYLITDAPQKKNATANFTLFNDTSNPLDEGIDVQYSEWFKDNTRKQFTTKVETYTIDDWRKKITSLQGIKYTLTLTFDPRNIHDIQLSSDKQWERLRTIIWQLSTKYKFKYYMVPELHEGTPKVHAHGIIIFPCYDTKCTNYKLQKNRCYTMEKLQKQVGKQVQNHPINCIMREYTSHGLQGDRRTTKKNITLKGWHDYCHGNTDAKKDKEKVYLEMGIASNFLKI